MFKALTSSFVLVLALAACHPKAPAPALPTPAAAPETVENAPPEPSIETPAPPAGPSIVDEADSLAQAGDIEGAVRLLSEHLEREGDDLRARMTLGWILDFDGRPEEAIKIWKKGLTGTEGDYGLWMSIGEIRARQGKDGPNVRYRRGTVTYHPGSDDVDEERFKMEHLELAAKAYRKARHPRPSPRATAALAGIYARLGKHAEAASAWRSIAEQYPAVLEVWLGLGNAEFADGRTEEAEAAAGQALIVNPRSAKAHNLVAEVCEAGGRTEEAAESRQRAQFFEWMAPFTTAVFTPERFATFATIAGLAREKDEVAREAQGRLRTKTIEALFTDDSAFASDLLASVAWHHADHGELEDEAYVALEDRRAVDSLLGLLEHAGSTCTIRSAGHALARLRAPGALEALARLLPGDVRVFMPGDIAGALAELNDPRAVPDLVQVLSPRLPAAEQTPEDRMHTAAGRNEARQRAALALGAFDTPESRQSLEQCLDNADFAVYCHTALFALTREPGHLEPVAELLRGKEGKFEHEIVELLERIDEPAAQNVAAEWRARSWD